MPVQILRRILVILALVMPLSALPAAAQDAVGAEPWQDVITQQIEAFRHQDAPGAFELAGDSFQHIYPSAELFFAAIVSSGYAPIMDSVSHSFGEFKLDPELGVVQIVKFVGSNQQLYEALYQLREEDGGWRVQGVALRDAEGVGI